MKTPERDWRPTPLDGMLIVAGALLLIIGLLSGHYLEALIAGGFSLMVGLGLYWRTGLRWSDIEKHR